MTKIAIISTMAGFPWGGSEYLWATMAEQALLEGHQVFLSIYDWSINQPAITQLKQQGALVMTRPRHYPLAFRIINRISKKWTLLKIISLKSEIENIFDFKPDVICISQGFTYDVPSSHPELINLLYSTSIPYLFIHQLNVDYFLPDSNTRNTARILYSRASHNVFVSHHNYKLTERQLAQSLPNGLVLQNPSNLKEFGMVEWVENSTLNFASVARLEADPKGQDILFESLSLPQWQQRDWKCNLYGSGPDLAYLEALTRYYNIADKVSFKGYVNDVRSIWRDNHLLLLPSRAEGTPLALVEAMLCGRPAVVTDVGGNAEWIDNGQTGFVAEAATAKSFGEALERAWRDRKNWKQIGIKAHEYAIDKLDCSPGRSLLKLVLETAKLKR